MKDKGWRRRIEKVVWHICDDYFWGKTEILSVESQKGVIADQRCSVENQKGTIAIDLYSDGTLLVLNGNIFELQ